MCCSIVIGTGIEELQLFLATFCLPLSLQKKEYMCEHASTAIFAECVYLEPWVEQFDSLPGILQEGCTQMGSLHRRVLHWDCRTVYCKWNKSVNVTTYLKECFYYTFWGNNHVQGVQASSVASSCLHHELKMWLTLWFYSELHVNNDCHSDV